MSWVLLSAAMGLFIVAPVVGVVEARRRRAGPSDVGFWVFARSVAGSTHVRWGHRQSPIVRFQLPGAEGRARVDQSPEQHVVSLRARLEQPLGFAGRICAPPRPPVAWRTPGLVEVESPEGFSVQTTQTPAMQAFLAYPTVFEALTDLAGEVEFELLLNHGAITLNTPVGTLSPGEALAEKGPALVNAMRSWLRTLQDAPDAAQQTEGEAICSACAGALGPDPQICRGCGLPLHRGCRVTLQGCINGACTEAADALPGAGASAV
jgi:hypothetical protein